MFDVSRLYRLDEVVQSTGLSKPSIYRLAAIGKFPKPIKIGERASAWRGADLAEWLESRAAGGNTQHSPRKAHAAA